MTKQEVLTLREWYAQVLLSYVWQLEWVKNMPMTPENALKCLDLKEQIQFGLFLVESAN